MIQVEIFSCDQREKLVKMVNDWIRDNDVNVVGSIGFASTISTDEPSPMNGFKSRTIEYSAMVSYKSNG
jgi:hypothetical protein